MKKFDKAKLFVKTLLDLDSWGQEHMPSNYSYQKVYRAKHPERRKMERDTYYAQGDMNTENAKKSWSINEDLAIVAPDRPIDRELSKKLGRTIRAIHARRTKILLKKLPREST